MLFSPGEASNSVNCRGADIFATRECFRNVFIFIFYYSVYKLCVIDLFILMKVHKAKLISVYRTIITFKWGKMV